LFKHAEIPGGLMNGLDLILTAYIPILENVKEIIAPVRKGKAK
jgi:hypothetical protein